MVTLGFAPRLALVASLALGALACSSEPSPRGYHSPNVAWADEGLGLVWLDRRVPAESVVFARARDDAKLVGKPIALSSTAWHSDPPLVASDGRSHLVAWTQAGGREPGLWVRAVGPDGPEGPEQRIVESTVHLCPQLAWVGDADDTDAAGAVYVVAWHEQTELYLGRIERYAVLDQAPLRVAEADGIAGCRVGWSGRELGVLWWTPSSDGMQLTLTTVSPRGDVREWVRVHTEGAVAAGPIDLAPHGRAWLVGYTVEGEPGARTVWVEPGRGQQPGPALERERWIRDLSLASASWLGAAWSESARPGARSGRIFFDLLGERGGAPLELATDLRARVGVSTSARERNAAVTWSGVAGGGTVGWAVIRFREAGQPPAVAWGALDQ